MRELLPTIAAAVTPLILLAILLVGPTLGLVEWQPSILWKTEFGTPCGTPCTHIENVVIALAADKTGLYASGYLGGAASPPVATTSTYSFLNRYDLKGGQAWSKNLGSLVIEGISAGADGVYVAARNGSSSLAQKYDLNGNKIWSSQLGSVSVFTLPISAGRVGVYITGLGPLPSNQTYPVIVQGYDLSGNLVWTNSPANVYGFPSVYADSSGVYVTGSNFLGKLDTHAFVSKYDSNGALQWNRHFDEPGFTCWCAPTGISGDSSGVYVLGSTENAFPGKSLGGYIDSFVRKYDSNGNVIWTIQFLAPNLLSTGSYQITANSSGVYLVVTGNIMRYDSNGNRVWSLSMQPKAIAVGQEGLYVGGSLNGYNAFVASVSESSSLILFGVDPPFSFVIAALLVSAVLSSVLWLGKGWRKKPRPLQRSPPPATIPRKGLET